MLHFFKKIHMVHLFQKIHMLHLFQKIHMVHLFQKYIWYICFKNTYGTNLIIYICFKNTLWYKRYYTFSSPFLLLYTSVLDPKLVVGSFLVVRVFYYIHLFRTILYTSGTSLNSIIYILVRYFLVQCIISSIIYFSHYIIYF